MLYHETILLVEDDSNDQTFIVEAFRSIGVESPIHVVSSGSEAIAYLIGEGKFANRAKYGYPTFIITDLKMSGGSGFSVLEHLRQNPEWSIIPKVVLSSSDDPDDVKRAYRLGASCYHRKPMSQADLCDQLQILHDYWQTCIMPASDVTGKLLQTHSKGKLGEEFPQPVGGAQRRVRH